ncbi:MAG TPA: hypothetical protein VMT87_07730 [Vicinamibacteria bacterium]|nr:hypothetical protein [Vicinamibacteria bacterium]
MALFVLLVVLTVIAGAAQLVSGAPTFLFASAVAAIAGMAGAFAVVWRSRPGPRAVVAAILALVNIVLALRAIVTPR